MVQIIPRNPRSASELLGQGISSGLAQGAQTASDYALKRSLLKAEKQPLLDWMKKVQEKNKINLIPDSGDKINLLNQNQQQEINPSQEQIDELAFIDPNLASYFQKKNEIDRKESFKREMANEPKLLEINESLESSEKSKLRFDRLSRLFSPELENKFPPTFAVGFLTKDGELSPLAQSQLSSEAQEAVKLITDEIKGAKGTFGARVTNFDAQTYLKTLPSLLNTQEGKRKVLRDLKIMNELDILESEGVLNIIDRHGGPGKMSISSAKRIFRKEFAPKIEQLRKEFVDPNSVRFSDLPDASRYVGEKIQDEESGQIFRSNGKEWVLENK